MIESFTCVYSPRVSVWEFGGLLETEKIGKPNKRNPCVATEEARKWTVVLITLIDGNLCSPKKTSRDNYYSLSRRCVFILFFLFFFLPFFFIYSVLVARAAVTRFPFAHTHTIYPSIYPFHLSSFSYFFFARQSHADNHRFLFVCLLFFFLYTVAHPFFPLSLFFPFPIVSFVLSVLSNLWLYEYILNNRLILFCDIVAVFQASFWCSRLTASVSMTVCRRWRWRWRWYR